MYEQGMPTDSARRAERRRSGAGCIDSPSPARGPRPPCRPRAFVSRTSVLILRASLAIFVAIPILATGTWGAKPQQQHNSNWAVLVETSKYWFNYRHMANTLSLYRTVKRLGIPDSNIILMMGDDVACDARNSFPGAIFNNRDHRLNLYGDNIEVDYRGYEVTVESFIRVLTGRHDAAVPRSKRLLSDAGSNVLVYITGHGGDGFMKFLDNEEMLSRDIADAIQQMWEKGRYRELLFMVETCQAGTLYTDIHSPYVISCACSAKGEMSYSHHNDGEVGLSVIDRFTYHTLEFFEKVGIHSNVTLRQLFDSYDNQLLDSSFNFNAPDPSRLDSARVTEFFGSVASTRPTTMPATSSDGPGAGHRSDPESSTLQPAADARPSSPHLLHRRLSPSPSHIASAEVVAAAAPSLASLPADHAHTGPSLLSRALASATSHLPTEPPPMRASMDAAIAAGFLALLAAAALRVALTSPPPSS